MAKKATPPKSPINIVRDIKTIADDYGATCAKAGEAQFKMKVLEGDLNTFNKRLVELHQEHMAAVKNHEKKAEQESEDQDKTA